MNPSSAKEVAQSLVNLMEREATARKYARAMDVLQLVGAGVFIAASIAAPNLPRTLKPLLSDTDEKKAWKRFNIPYLKRTLRRLEEQRLIRTFEKDGTQSVHVTDRGREKLFQCSLDTLVIEKPLRWDKTWWLVSYDIPAERKHARHVLHEYLRAWKFYPLHESAFLHAYPCEQHVEFLREYLHIGQYVRIFTVTKIENDQPFREFFGV